MRKAAQGTLRALVFVAAMPCANGQALFTGETSGKGVSSIFVAATAGLVPDFTQHYAGLGSNVGILRRARHRVDLAFLNMFSTPINRRDQAATVSAVFAPIASRPVRLRRYEMTLYGGYLRAESLGQRAGKLFSPPKGTHNGIVGAVLPLTKSLSLVAEYDPGHSQHNVGLALLYLFPRK